MVGFDYFGRPALVIEGLFNARLLPLSDATAYSLGTPKWGWWRVDYPIVYSTQTQVCTGTITLEWRDLDWQSTQAETRCLSS